MLPPGIEVTLTLQKAKKGFSVNPRSEGMEKFIVGRMISVLGHEVLLILETSQERAILSLHPWEAPYLPLFQ